MKSSSAINSGPSSSTNEQNNKRRIVLPSLGGKRSRQPLGTLSAAGDESFDNNNDVTLGTLQTNSSASNYSASTGSSSLHSGQSSLTGRRPPPRCATAATKNNDSSESHPRDGEECTSNSISSILSSQTTKNERVLRYGETMGSLFCLNTAMGDEKNDNNNNNDEERHKTLCQEICSGTKSNNVVAWKEVLELSLERNNDNNNAREGGNSDVGKRLILLHRRATSRFKLVNSNNSNNNNTTTDDNNDKKDKQYILQIWLLYAMVLLKYNSNNDEKNSTNNSNNDPRQTIKHIQRLYFNKCSNEFYGALLVQQQQHQKQQQQQKEGQHQEEEEEKKKTMDSDQIICTLQQLLVNGIMSVVEIVKCQMHQLESCGLLSDDDNDVVGSTTTETAAQGAATTNTSRVGNTVATASVAPVRLISLPSLGNKKGGTRVLVASSSTSSTTALPASQRMKTYDDDGNDKSTLLSSSYQRTKRPLKSMSSNSDSEGGGDLNGIIKPSSIRAKLESRKKKMKTNNDRGPHPYRTRRGSSSVGSSGNKGGGLRAILSQTLEEGDDESSDDDDDHYISAKRSAESCTSVASSNVNDSHLFQDISPIDQEPTTSVKDMDLNYLLNWDPTKRSDATTSKTTKKRVTIVAEDAKKKKTSSSSSSSTMAIPKITKNDLGYMMNWNPFDKFENKKDDDIDSLDKSSRVEDERGVVVHQQKSSTTAAARGKNHINDNNMSTIDEATEGSLTSAERENNHVTSQSRASCSSQEESNDVNANKSAESKKRSSRSSVGNGSDLRNEENEKSSLSTTSSSHASENTNMISTTKLDCSFLPLIEKKNIIRVENDSYAKLGVIGKGGSCKVYRALSRDCDVVALKKVKLDGLNKAAIDGYANEIALLKRLKGNPAIIQLYSAEVDLERKSILLVMELGEVDLNYVLRQQELLSSKQQGNRAAGGSRSSLNMNFIRLTWQQMLTAVHSIHEERIIHSDLKPANFLFVRGALKLIDFGIAKAIEREDTTNVYRETLSGTLSYMSPEAIMDTSTNAKGVRVNKCGRPSDIWSLGCILYQMVYGKTPFADCHGIPQKVLAITNVNHQINFPVDGVDESAIDAMKVCLNRDPKQRPPIVGKDGLLNEHCFLHGSRKR